MNQRKPEHCPVFQQLYSKNYDSIKSAISNFTPGKNKRLSTVGIDYFWQTKDLESETQNYIIRNGVEILSSLNLFN